MKQLKLVATALVASAALFLFSCGSGNDKKMDSTATDSSSTKQTEPGATTTPQTTGPTHLVLFRHKVAAYAKWKMGYDAHDSARKAAGMHNYVLARGLGKDSNTILVVMKADDIIKAKEFASSTDLRDAMQKSGVIGTPVIDYEDVVMDDNSQIPESDRLLVTHKVKDFDTWKTVFDGDKQARIDAGIIDRAITHASGDTHSVTTVFALSDLAKAKAFIASKNLKDKMEQAGVDGPPTFFYFTIVQKY